MQPDILLMQETKLSDEAFPALAFMGMGYETAHHGQGQWNGVAILSKVGLSDVVMNFADGEPDPDARIITALCGDMRVTSVYVPNGRSLEDDHYQYKLRWLAQLREHVALTSSPDDAVIVAGDFNIAPTDLDVYDPAKFVGATHTSPPERALLTELCDWGMVDLFRKHHSEGKLYSWWDYRAGDFHQGRGLRIDLVLGTKAVADRCTWSVIDRNARKGTMPSDHAPVIVELD
ncbi:MAG: exodeoxyribonuclease [Ilumatobacteraceae bacterium]